jgi:hypothetical protein
MQDNLPLDRDDQLVHQRVARYLIKGLGAQAGHYTRGQADIAAGQSASVWAKTWRAIADAVEQLSRKP